MHSISTLTVSRERQKPASSMVKPTCMPNTRNAATSVHTVLIGIDDVVALQDGIGGVYLEAHQTRIDEDARQDDQSYSQQFSSQQNASVLAPFRIAEAVSQAGHFVR